MCILPIYSPIIPKNKIIRESTIEENSDENDNLSLEELIKEVVNYGFNVMKLHSIEAIIAPENLASEKVLQKNGFVKEAHLKENEYYEEQFLDTVIYSILNQH